MYPQNNFNDNTADMQSKTWKIAGDILAGFIDGDEATSQSINLRLKNIVSENIIFSDTYGSEINDILGESYDMICLKLPGIIERAVSFDDRVIGADNFEFAKYEDNVLVKFRLILVRNSLDMEVVV